MIKAHNINNGQAEDHSASTISILVAVKNTRYVDVVGMMDDVQYSRDCVGQQHSEVELPVSRLLTTFCSDSSMTTIRASQYQPVQTVTDSTVY